MPVHDRLPAEQRFTDRRDVIDTAITPRVAPEDTPSGERRPLDQSISLNRGVAIMRTRGIVPATWADQRREGPLVQPNESHPYPPGKEKDPAYHSHRGLHDDPFSMHAVVAPRTSVDNSANDAVAARGSARITSPVPPGSVGRTSATIALSRRLTVFRVTAFPTARETAKPTTRRGPSIRPACTTTVVRPLAVPRRITVLKSVAARIRRLGGST